MALFHYPKVKHRRRLAPRRFKNYRSYKRYLQNEFSRVCVYCRQPDSSAPNLNFGIDHYKPKGLQKFANLICDYSNLYYCCGSCNSRKNDYWPTDENAGPFIVAPCEHEMALHLRFNSKTGQIESRTVNGSHTVELLQLNEVATVQYRLTTLRIVDSFTAEVEKQEKLLKDVTRLFRNGKITQAQFDFEEQNIKEELKILHLTIQQHSGELALPPLRKVCLGISLMTP